MHFSTKKKKKPKNKGRTCFKCNLLSHLSKKCDSNDAVKKNNSEKTDEKKVYSKVKTAFVAQTCEEKKRENSWYLDSGEGRHMTPFDVKIFNVQESDIKEIISACGNKKR